MGGGGEKVGAEYGKHGGVLGGQAGGQVQGAKDRTRVGCCRTAKLGRKACVHANEHSRRVNAELAAIFASTK